MKKFEKYFVLGIFFFITFLYYHDTLNNWFIYDDAAAIYYSMEPLKEIPFGINYSHAFYTPLVNLSFKPDVMFFGLKPLPYHIHNTLILVLISFMAYQILRLYRNRIISFLASLVILFTTPSLVCLEWITLRQYLYSMLFSLVAVYLFLKYKPDPKNNKLIVFIILILCELSFMGKEQFMTLPFILFIISEGNFKNRMSKVYPYFILLAGHFILRIYVLEGLGGYLGFKYNTIVYLRTTIGSIFTASKILFGYNWFVVPVVIPLLKRPKKILLSIILWLTSLSISFFTMYTYPEMGSFRYWFMPAVLFSFLIGFSAGFVKNTLLKYRAIRLTALPPTCRIWELCKITIGR